MKQVKQYREEKGPDGEPMKVRVMPPDATIEELEAAVMEDTAVAMTDEQAAKVDARLEEGVRDGRAL
ncbi:MAG: hypothetical protein OXH92_09370 [Bryobacterales bacterium]|nr:hypothetical protein [Bryobacterales bacterium]MDE0434203.1 hypothetical protein [Bryobacterales bacterium]